MRNFFYFATVLLTLACSHYGRADESARPLYLGLTAEFGVMHSTSAQAVEAGIKLAIAEINQAGGVLGGRPLVLDSRDDRSVPARGVANVRAMAQNPDLVAVFTSKLSPVALDILPVAHAIGLPLLAPWSAADGIIDHAFQPSYSFRLSLRDTWAIDALLEELHHRRGLERLGVLLPNTGWGRSCYAAAERHQDGVKLEYEWYNWGASSLMPAYERLLARQAEAILLVANEREGAILIKEMAALPAAQRLPVVSHWGITGGQFMQLTGQALKHIDLAVLQTFTFNDPPTEAMRRVRASAQQWLKLDLNTLPSAVGFAHAYDLTHILARALELAGSASRSALRAALEQVRDYPGLVTHYAAPFTAERHEALSPEFVFMAHFQPDGTLVRNHRTQP